jgi:hypothetical protein
MSEYTVSNTGYTLTNGNLSGNFTAQTNGGNANPDYEEMWGFDIPDYHRRRNAGELLPLTDYYHCKIKGSGTFQWHSSLGQSGDGVTTPYTRNVSGSFISYAPSVNDLESYLQNQDPRVYADLAAAKIYSSGFDAMSFLYELRETRRMFKDITERVVQALRDRRIEKLWLEGRFGWRTLLYDCQQLFEVIRGLQHKRSRFSERAGTTFQSVATWYDTPNLPIGDTVFNVTVTDTYTLGLRGHVVADVSPPSFSFNPFVSAWELTRLSFVVDWLIDVGAYLQELSLRSIATKYYASYGFQLSLTRNVSGTASMNPSTDYQSLRTVSGYADGTYTCLLQRRVPTSLSNTPHINVNLDFLKCLDLLALLAQALRRR